MTKLEKKLIELGYKRTTYFDTTEVIWWKGSIAIETNEGGLEILRANIQAGYINKQSQIDNLQETFNELQKDLEVLKNEQYRK